MMLGSSMCWCRIFLRRGTIVKASPENLTGGIGVSVIGGPGGVYAHDVRWVLVRGPYICPLSLIKPRELIPL